MNYKKHYDLLIERSKNRVLEGYVEKHHIVPRCLGGTDDKENLAMLTPEEHFLAHQLLIRLNPGHRGLIYAAQMMTSHHTKSRTNNKLFGWIRRRMALSMSEQTKTRLKEKGHPKGFLGKTHTAKKKEQIAASTKAAIVADRGVPVYTYNLDGTFCKSYITLTDCADDLKTNPSNVKYTAEGKFGYCKGKMIRYEYFPKIDPYVKPISKLKGYTRSEEHQKNLREAIKNNKATCSNCGFTAHKSAITRAHNDKCKHKNKNI